LGGSWLPIRLVCAVVIVVCGFVQGLAMRRLSGEYRIRAQSVVRVAVVSGYLAIPMLVVSENRAFTMIVTLILCVIALASTGFFVNVLRGQKAKLNHGNLRADG